MSTTAIPLVRAGPPPRTVTQGHAWPIIIVMLDALSRWLTRRHDRAALANLAGDRHLLRDIGLTREQALYEAGKRFWR